MKFMLMLRKVTDRKNFGKFCTTACFRLWTDDARGPRRRRRAAQKSSASAADESGRCAAENLKLLPPTIGRRAAVIAAKNVHFKFEFECVLHAAICLLTYSVRSYLNKSKKKSTKVSILQQSTGTEC